MAEVQAFVAPAPDGQGNRIYLRTPFSMRQVCMGLPGRKWEPTIKQWHVPATAQSAGAVLEAFGGHELNTDKMFETLLIASQVIGDPRTAKDLPNTPTRTTAWLHQRRAFAFAQPLDAAMLAMDMGTGKSMVSIALHQDRDVRRVLILCPVSVVGVWPKQFLTHALDPDEWMMAGYASRSSRMRVTARAEILARALRDGPRMGRRVVCIANYEAAWRRDMEALLRDQQWDAVVLDESHRVKSAGGKASMFATRLRAQSRYRLCLTGTPMPHSPADIYAQYRFLDPSVFGTSKNRFLNRYAVMKQIKENVNVIDDWQNMDEFNERFASLAFVVSKEEALPDLPEKMPPMERYFSLGHKALKAYMDLSREFVAGVEEGTILATNALTRVMRFRQITSGHARTMEGGTVHLDDGREKLLRDVLEDLNEPVVVYAAFHEDLNAIERVSVSLGRAYGELSGRRRDGLAPDSTMNPDIGVLGCQLKSGGVGIDLTRSSVAIYYSIGYELGDVQQSEDRLHRPGQTRPVRYIHLIADNAPIDSVMRQALGARKDLVGAVMDAAKEHQL